MNFNDQNRNCHAERSEASVGPASETLRFAQGDTTFPIRTCHAERSEASLGPASETLRGVYPERSEWAQDDSEAKGDTTFPILPVKVHHCFRQAGHLT